MEKLSLILESIYDRKIQEFNRDLSLMESSGYAITDLDVVAGQRFITESTLRLSNILMENNILQNVRDNLGGYAAAAGLGAGGMYLYNNYTDPTDPTDMNGDPSIENAQIANEQQANVQPVANVG